MTDINDALTTLASDPYKQVLQTSFDLISDAKDIAGDDDSLFESMFQMVLDYQRAAFEDIRAES